MPRAVIIIPALLFLIGLAVLIWWWTRPPKPYAKIVTLAVAGRAERPVNNHYEPFGLTADQDGNIYFSESVTGRIYKIPVHDYSSNPVAPNQELIVDGLETPSTLALDGDDHLLVANTGAHTILRVDLKKRQTSVIAGVDGASGDQDGPAGQARFNGPVGLCVSHDGTIFIADTYNDRIRTISTDGQVRTIAGGREPGFADGAGSDARFDTPCGIAIAGDGSLLVADTGNHRIRRVEPNGRVTTIAGNGVAEEIDGRPLEASFDQPTSIAVRDERSFYVADSAGLTVRLCQFTDRPEVRTLAGGYPNGLADDELFAARLNRPAGLALLPDGELAFADSGNGLIRAFVPAGSGLGLRADPQSVILQPDQMRALVEPRWPFDPPQARRDIAGTLGEIRGERLPDREAWFHNGLDVPGAYGEIVRAVLTERVTQPLAVEAAAETRERLRLPLFEYIHLRIGRDQNDQPLGNFPAGAITFRRDPEGQISGVRVRRGTRIAAGEPIGALNRLNHVHLVAGPAGFEFNALAALKLPGLSDGVAPTIENIAIFNQKNEMVFDSAKAPKDPAPLSLSGKLRIVVRAYDQVDGNPRYRRLGVYRLGYQIPGSTEFGAPRYNIVFDRLSSDPKAVILAYAEGSQSGYEGVTIFDYIVTNIVSHGDAREDFLDLSKLAPGNYTLRVMAEDFFGNQARRDLPFFNRQD